MRSRGIALFLAGCALCALPGCVVVSVAKTTVGAATTVVGTAVEVTAAVGGAVIPDGEDRAEDSADD